jgi:hypothetical protein
VASGTFFSERLKAVSRIRVEHQLIFKGRARDRKCAVPLQLSAIVGLLRGQVEERWVLAHTLFVIPHLNSCTNTKLTGCTGMGLNDLPASSRC